MNDFCVSFRLGNTSTGVEKTFATTSPGAFTKKHLHGRGEDIIVLIRSWLSKETPPRAWRRRTCHKMAQNKNRNTSTGVEKTGDTWRGIPRRQKHLHGRGEDLKSLAGQIRCSETPPRAWRRPHTVVNPVIYPRNTSTGVEKTHQAVLAALLL